MFWHNEEFATGLGRDIALDGVICVVDAVFGKKVGVRVFFIGYLSPFTEPSANGTRQQGRRRGRKSAVSSPVARSCV